MANILDNFKELSISDVNDRVNYSLTTDESTKATTILENFFTYFKAKHSQELIKKCGSTENT